MGIQNFKKILVKEINLKPFLFKLQNKTQLFKNGIGEIWNFGK